MKVVRHEQPDLGESEEIERIAIEFDKAARDENVQQIGLTRHEVMQIISSKHAEGVHFGFTDAVQYPLRDFIASLLNELLSVKLCCSGWICGQEDDEKTVNNLIRYDVQVVLINEPKEEK